MSDVLRARSASYFTGTGDDRREVTLSQGDTIPDDVPRDTLQAWRDAGALQGPDADLTPAGGAEVAPAPDATGTDPARGGGPTAPDPLTATTEDLAAYIEAQDLNAADTVALAQGDPGRAQAVLEAEQLAQGGDGRKTVAEPLSKLAGQGGGE